MIMFPQSLSELMSDGLIFCRAVPVGSQRQGVANTPCSCGSRSGIYTENTSETRKADTDSIEMLTITEAIEEFPGFTRSTIRQIITQNKIRYFRTPHPTVFPQIANNAITSKYPPAQ